MPRRQKAKRRDGAEDPALARFTTSDIAVRTSTCVCFLDTQSLFGRIFPPFLPRLKPSPLSPCSHTVVYVPPMCSLCAPRWIGSTSEHIGSKAVAPRESIEAGVTGAFALLFVGRVKRKRRAPGSLLLAVSGAEALAQAALLPAGTSRNGCPQAGIRTALRPSPG